MLHCKKMRCRDTADRKFKEFRAACVAWVLKQYEVGCPELEGLSLDGLDDLDDTRAFRVELQSYVVRTGSLPPAVGAGRSAEEKRLHTGLVQVRKRRFAAVRRDRAGRIIDYAAALQETQLVAWEAVPEFGPISMEPSSCRCLQCSATISFGYRGTSYSRTEESYRCSCPTGSPH